MYTACDCMYGLTGGSITTHVQVHVIPSWTMNWQLLSSIAVLRVSCSLERVLAPAWFSLGDTQPAGATFTVTLCHCEKGQKVLLAYRL